MGTVALVELVDEHHVGEPKTVRVVQKQVFAADMGVFSESAAPEEEGDAEEERDAED